MNKLLLCLAAAGFVSAPHAATLSFDGDICSLNNDGSGSFVACSNFSRINQAYGDIPGVDVSYGSTIGSPDSMMFWADSYSTLERVAFGDSGGGSPTVTLTALGGGAVTLTSFQIGSWPNADRTSQVTVTDLDGGALVVSTGPITIFGAAPSIFSINASSSVGFVINFGPEGYNVGIDNVAYSAGAVPEPAAWALMAVGLLATAGLARRQR
jgi:hypothetical protein